MALLSQALRLGDLPPPHRTFQGHATHIIEWSMMLRPNDSWSTCILQGIATFLHYASRRSAGYRDTTLCLAFCHSMLSGWRLQSCFDAMPVDHLRRIFSMPVRSGGSVNSVASWDASTRSARSTAS